MQFMGQDVLYRVVDLSSKNNRFMVMQFLSLLILEKKVEHQ